MRRSGVRFPSRALADLHIPLGDESWELVSVVRPKGWISTGSRPPVHSYCPFGRRGRPKDRPPKRRQRIPWPKRIDAMESRQPVPKHGTGVPISPRPQVHPEAGATLQRWAPSPAEDVCGVGTPPVQAAARRPCTPPATALLHLQRTAGNTAVAAYLQRQRPRQSAPEMDVDAGEPRATAPEETRRAGRRPHWREDRGGFTGERSRRLRPPATGRGRTGPGASLPLHPERPRRASSGTTGQG